VLTTLLPYVLLYKYFAIFVITFIGAFALPVPSGSVLMAAAAFSIQGYMSFPLVLVTGIAGNMAGDNSAYWLVSRYGLKVLDKLHLKRFFSQARLDGARDQINRHPILTIYFSRFMTGIAPAVNVVAGITELPYKRYLLFEGLGEVTECSFFCFIGYIFGSNWEYVSQLGGKSWIIIIAGMLVTFMVGRVIFKKK
jgi:membrane-associated protein